MAKREIYEPVVMNDVLHADWEGVPMCGMLPEGAYLVDFPEFAVRYVGGTAFPEEVIHQIFAPGWRQVFVEHVAHLVAEPGLGVDAVGDGFDRLFARFEIREDVPPHVVADFAVELADAVAVAREFEGEDRHAERLVILGTEREDLFHAEAGRLAVIGEVFSDEMLIERFVAGRHRRVRSENGTLCDFFARVSKTLAGFNIVADAFEGEERAMAFVHVPDIGRVAQQAQGAHATDSQDDLLGNAQVQVAAVQASCEFPVGR